MAVSVKSKIAARPARKRAAASARRTVDTERAGLTALSAALDNGLAAPFAEAVDRHPGARQGRVVVSGVGKSGHIGRKIASTLASTGTPAFFVHPAEASHGDLGMVDRGRRDPGAVVVGRDGRASQPRRIFAPLSHSR